MSLLGGVREGCAGSQNFIPTARYKPRQVSETRSPQFGWQERPNGEPAFPPTLRALVKERNGCLWEAGPTLGNGIIHPAKWHETNAQNHTPQPHTSAGVLGPGCLARSPSTRSLKPGCSLSVHTASCFSNDFILRSIIPYGKV